MQQQVVPMGTGLKAVLCYGKHLKKPTSHGCTAKPGLEVLYSMLSGHTQLRIPWGSTGYALAKG